MALGLVEQRLKGKELQITEPPLSITCHTPCSSTESSKGHWTPSRGDVGNPVIPTPCVTGRPGFPAGSVQFMNLGKSLHLISSIRNKRQRELCLLYPSDQPETEKGETDSIPLLHVLLLDNCSYDAHVLITTHFNEH